MFSKGVIVGFAALALGTVGVVGETSAARMGAGNVSHGGGGGAGHAAGRSFANPGMSSANAGMVRGGSRGTAMRAGAFTGPAAGSANWGGQGRWAGGRTWNRAGGSVSYAQRAGGSVSYAQRQDWNRGGWGGTSMARQGWNDRGSPTFAAREGWNRGRWAGGYGRGWRHGDRNWGGWAVGTGVGLGVGLGLATSPYWSYGYAAPYETTYDDAAPYDATYGYAPYDTTYGYAATDDTTWGYGYSPARWDSGYAGGCRCGW